VQRARSATNLPHLLSEHEFHSPNDGRQRRLQTEFGTSDGLKKLAANIIPCLCLTEIAPHTNNGSERLHQRPCSNETVATHKITIRGVAHVTGKRAHGCGVDVPILDLFVQEGCVVGPHTREDHLDRLVAGDLGIICFEDCLNVVIGIDLRKQVNEIRVD
jgi:hypothetical protein